jgi:hypothetical protein
VVAFNFLLVRPLPFGSQLLEATALATSLGVVVGLALSIVEVRRAAGGVVAPLTAVRVVIATAACITLGRLLPDLSRVVTLLASGVIFTLYVGLLTLFREVGANDLRSVKAIVRRKR